MTISFTCHLTAFVTVYNRSLSGDGLQSKPHLLSLSNECVNSFGAHCVRQLNMSHQVHIHYVHRTHDPRPTITYTSQRVQYHMYLWLCATEVWRRRCIHVDSNIGLWTSLCHIGCWQTCRRLSVTVSPSF